MRSVINFRFPTKQYRNDNIANFQISQLYQFILSGNFRRIVTVNNISGIEYSYLLLFMHFAHLKVPHW